ncbi:helix-turn-helix transcriptional regulator [Amycolatopsis minnesotensis]|uniref:Helix-turn-helix transcriptional regulator n=1 Tax=Amycolatopsis minnesotensis TaxID=337894 RepID=A0ABN2S0U0_9PSEU
MAQQNPQRFELGEMLRTLRERVGVQAKTVEDDLRWYPGKVSRVEQGKRVPVAAEIDRLADLYKLNEGERSTLHLLADAARKRESSAHVADFAQTYVTLERAAIQIDHFDAELIHALVQTEAYARALLDMSLEGQVADLVADRIARQAILARPEPPRLRVLLGEASLHRMVGGADVMREQLDHLLQAGKRPNVSIRILPNSVGAYRTIGVGFKILRLASPNLTRVYIEGMTDATYIHEADETAVYETAFDEVWGKAANNVESGNILRRRIEEID